MSGGGKGGEQTVGYRYSMGVHMGICHGPVDALLEIRAGDRTAWSGSVTGNSTVSINAPDLFGGEEREGGLSGILDVMMGGAAQGANGYLAGQQGGTQPAYRGILGLVYRGLVAANNPYLKPWSVRVRRILSGWDGGSAWNAANAEITLPGGLVAANPAHIVYEALTNRRWGNGYPAGRLDTASFTAAAATFKAEGLGLCLVWQQQAPVEDLLQQIMDHAGAAVGEDPRTGLIRMRAIRPDYTVGNLPLFSDSAGNVIDLEAFERAAPTDATNELSVRFTDQATGKQGTVTVQNLASVQAQGRVNAAVKEYPGIPTAALATRIALRDVTAASSCLARVRMRVTRAAYGVLPGDVIAFSWPELGVSLMPLRIGRVDYGSLTAGIITIEAVQDVFGMPGTTYVNPQPPGWVEPSRVPLPTPAWVAMEAPYRDLARTLGQSAVNGLDPNAAFLATMAARPSGLSINYLLETRVGSAAFASAGNGEWTPGGTLSAALTPVGGTLSLSGAVDMDLVSPGQAAMINGEIIRIDSIDAAGTTLNIARGCADTVPRQHAAGSRLWCYQTLAGADPTEYATGETVTARIRTRTTAGLLEATAAPAGAITMAQRAARPYPPGALRLNGLAYPATITGTLTVSWAHRDRVSQSDQLVDTSLGNIGPEPGTTYTVMVYGNDLTTVRRTVNGITATSYTWDTEAQDCGLFGAERLPVSVSQSSLAAGATAATTANLRDSTANTGTGTNAGALEWIQVDLGSAQSVGMIEVAGGTLAGFGAVAPALSGRVVQSSDDNATWTTRASVPSLNDSGASAYASFAPVSARYWRLATTTSGQAVAATRFQLWQGGALNASLRVRVRAVRGGLDSWQEHDVTVAR